MEAYNRCLANMFDILGPVLILRARKSFFLLANLAEMAATFHQSAGFGKRQRARLFSPNEQCPKLGKFWTMSKIFSKWKMSKIRQLLFKS